MTPGFERGGERMFSRPHLMTVQEHVVDVTRHAWRHCLARALVAEAVEGQDVRLLEHAPHLISRD